MGRDDDDQQEDVVLGGLEIEQGGDVLSPATFVELGKKVGESAAAFFDVVKETGPQQVTLEIGIGLKTEGQFLWFVRAGANADVKAKFMWESKNEKRS